jgi:tRNA A37 methylthiotransferase MiaB
MVGKTLRVFVERADPRMEGALMARTEGRLPVRILQGLEEWIGTFHEVEIVSAAELSLTARRVGAAG